MLEVGKIVKPHGLLGEVKVVSWCDDMSEFENFKELYYLDKNEKIKLEKTSIKYQNNNLIIKFKGINTIDDTKSIINKILLVEKKYQKKLPQNTFFVVDLIGCSVYDENQNNLGVVVDVFKTGSNDVYVVKNAENKELLIPAISDVVKSIDIENKKIIIKMLEGLT